MIIKHDGATPRIDPTAWVAPNAVICGNVTIGPSCRVMFGAQVIAEGGSISIGCECINGECRSQKFRALPTTA
jgi:carbonic anhydrase/acetyltransferase-like protein (isoleucine patch superfamily)